MLLNISVNLDKLYYIRSRYGTGRYTRRKTFVRTPLFTNNKLSGSRMYCCCRVYGLLFTSQAEAERFMNLYNADSTVECLDLSKPEIAKQIANRTLVLHTYKNCDCFTLSRSFITI